MASVIDGVATLAAAYPGLIPTPVGNSSSSAATMPKRRDVLDDAGQTPDSLSDLLARLAEAQAGACRMSDVLGLFPRVSAAKLWDDLLRFLRTEDSDSGDDTGAAAFFTKTDTARYFRLFSTRAPMVLPLLRAADGLPPTICVPNLMPGDQTPQGVLSGTWERSLAGPAGMLLHAMLGGCAEVAECLGHGIDPDAERASHTQRQPTDAYANALQACGYAGQADLEHGLPGAVCAGVIVEILELGRSSSESSSERKAARGRMRPLLSDLLDMCDHLAMADGDAALACAADYAANGRGARARNLISRCVVLYPNDPDVLAQLAAQQQETGREDEAIETYEKILSLVPGHTVAHVGRGDLYLNQQRFEHAADDYEKAQVNAAPGEEIEQRGKLLIELSSAYREAKQNDAMPTVTVSDDEFATGKWHPARLSLALNMFRQYGALKIANAFDVDLLTACNRYFVKRYSSYFDRGSKSDALNIGDKRYQIGISLDGAFNNPGVYANKFVLSLMQALLGEDFVLGCTVCATSMPGAKDQHLHKDHKSLFSMDAAGEAVTLPPFAVTTMVPLVSLDHRIGTTSVRKGSHVLGSRASRDLPSQEPLVPLGSCFLMDFRLSHQGLANQTNTVRPIINMVYQRPWFFDSKNFTKHPPLHVPEGEFKKVPSEHRRLLEWGTRPAPQIAI